MKLRNVLACFSASLALLSTATATETATATVPKSKTVPNVENTATPTFSVIDDRVYAKHQSGSETIYRYKNGVLVEEKSPRGVGHYLYDRHGKFERIKFSDGTIIQVAALSRNSGVQLQLTGPAGTAEVELTKADSYDQQPSSAHFQQTVARLLSKLDVTGTNTPQQRAQTSVQAKSAAAEKSDISSTNSDTLPPGVAPADIAAARENCMERAYAAWEKMELEHCEVATSLSSRNTCKAINIRNYVEFIAFCNATFPDPAPANP